MNKSKKLELRANELLKSSKVKNKKRNRVNKEQIVLPEEVKELYRQFWRGLREL